MTQTDETRLTERQQYWLKHLGACDAAGTTTIDYARAQGINVKTLYSARKALAEKGTSHDSATNKPLWVVRWGFAVAKHTCYSFLMSHSREWRPRMDFNVPSWPNRSQFGPIGSRLALKIIAIEPF